MDFYESTSYTILGLSLGLYITGILTIYRLFNNINKVPLLISWALTCLMISSCLSMTENYWNPDITTTIVFIDASLYPQAVLISFWLYFKRLDQFYMGHKISLVMKIMAILTCLVLLGDVIVYILQVYGVDDGLNGFYYNIYTGIEFLYYLILESFLFTLLMKNIKKLMIGDILIHMALVPMIFCALICVDCVMSFLSFFQLTDFSNLFYAIPFFLRLHAAISFYAGLKDTHEIYQKSLESINFESPIKSGYL
eukprot:NODE_119_length_18186_cov_1.929397.p8 type:complete len:253 gc:universal NODE_119_length_18186_cov_1.929397:13542-12784(-)